MQPVIKLNINIGGVAIIVLEDLGVMELINTLVVKDTQDIMGNVISVLKHNILKNTAMDGNVLNVRMDIDVMVYISMNVLLEL